MLAKVIALACIATLSGGIGAFAQADGPAEQPPSDYKGQSYVDSAGCIFLKVGYGGEASWVPRVGKDRKPVCGQTPSQAVSNITEASATDVPAPRKSYAKPRVVGAAVPRAPVKIGCPASVPVARRYATTDGGSVVMCTATNGSLTGARSPIYPAGSGVAPALSKHRYAGVDIPLHQNPQTAAPQAFVPPKGYEVAWKDGRLNPLRGKGTEAGQAAQDKIWTRDVPAEAVIAKVAAPSAAKPTLSTSNGQTAAKLYVQVGAFGDPSNAVGASARLAALGLPVTQRQSGKGSGALQVVYAGPFASSAEAQSALQAARGHGFSDAFIR